MGAYKKVGYRKKTLCTECNKKFTNLGSHMSRAHKKDVPKPTPIVELTPLLLPTPLIVDLTLIKKELPDYSEEEKTPTTNDEVASLDKDIQNPIFCVFCSKPFLNQFGLFNHLVLHIEEKPHQCRHCDTSFSSREVLEKHERKKHGYTRDIQIVVVMSKSKI